MSLMYLYVYLLGRKSQCHFLHSLPNILTLSNRFVNATNWQLCSNSWVFHYLLSMRIRIMRRVKTTREKKRWARYHTKLIVYTFSKVFLDFFCQHSLCIMWYNAYGPTQVKCRLLICSIFYAMNFWHFFGNARISFMVFLKKSEIHCIINARN